MHTKKRKRIKSSRNLLEVVDKYNIPLAVLPDFEVYSQKLLHRGVLILLYNKEKKLFLQQRNKKDKYFPGFWDVSVYGRVKAGEAQADAVRRLLLANLNINIDNQLLIRDLQILFQEDCQYLSAFSVSNCIQQPQPSKKKFKNGFFVARNELKYLIENYSELITPYLIELWNSQLLFVQLQRNS